MSTYEEDLAEYTKQLKAYNKLPPEQQAQQNGAIWDAYMRVTNRCVEERKKSETYKQLQDVWKQTLDLYVQKNDLSTQKNELQIKKLTRPNGMTNAEYEQYKQSIDNQIKQININIADIDKQNEQLKSKRVAIKNKSLDEQHRNEHLMLDKIGVPPSSSAPGYKLGTNEVVAQSSQFNQPNQAQPNQVQLNQGQLNLQKPGEGYHSDTIRGVTNKGTPILSQGAKDNIYANEDNGTNIWGNQPNDGYFGYKYDTSPNNRSRLQQWSTRNLQRLDELQRQRGFDRANANYNDALAKWDKQNVVDHDANRAKMQADIGKTQKDLAYFTKELQATDPKSARYATVQNNVKQLQQQLQQQQNALSSYNPQAVEAKHQQDRASYEQQMAQRRDQAISDNNAKQDADIARRERDSRNWDRTKAIVSEAVAPAVRMGKDIYNAIDWDMYKQNPLANEQRKRASELNRTAGELESLKENAQAQANRNVQSMADEWTAKAAKGAGDLAANAVQEGGGMAAMARLDAEQKEVANVGAQNVQAAQQRADTYEGKIGERALAEDRARYAASNETKDMIQANEQHRQNLKEQKQNMQAMDEIANSIGQTGTSTAGLNEASVLTNTAGQAKPTNPSTDGRTQNAGQNKDGVAEGVNDARKQVLINKAKNNTLTSDEMKELNRMGISITEGEMPQTIEHKETSQTYADDANDIYNDFDKAVDTLKTREPSLYAELTRADYGKKSILDMVNVYRDGQSTPSVQSEAIYKAVQDFTNAINSNSRGDYSGTLNNLKAVLQSGGIQNGRY